MAQKYQNAPSGTHEHLLRLLQIAAASLNALAGMTYVSRHRDMELKPPEPPGGSHRLFHRTDAFFVNFYHTNYHFQANLGRIFLSGTTLTVSDKIINGFLSDLANYAVKGNQVKLAGLGQISARMLDLL